MRYYSRVFAAAALLSCAPLQAQALAAATSPIIVRAPHFVPSADAPNVLGTIAQPIRAGRFAPNVRHSFADASRLPILQRLVAPARRLTPLQQISYVQAAVNKNIRW